MVVSGSRSTAAVDSIVADDVGRFPDRSVAEAMARVDPSRGPRGTGPTPRAGLLTAGDHDDLLNADLFDRYAQGYRRSAPQAGVPTLGYFAQVPHYISGEYAPAAMALLDAFGTHLNIAIESPSLRAEADLTRTRLDAATDADEKTKSYVERLEQMVDEARLPAGDELISEIERFLRDRGSEPGHGQVH